MGTGENVAGAWNEALEDYLRASRVDGQAANTIKAKTELVGGLVKWAIAQGKSLESFGRAALRQFLDTRTCGDATKRQYVIMVRHFFKFLKTEELIAVNPLAEYKLPKAPKPVLKVPQRDELEALLRCVDRRWSPRSRKDGQKNSGVLAKSPADRRFYARRDSAILALLIGSAARISEILALEIGHVDLEGGEITIERGKGRKTRTIPVSADARPYVEEWLRVRGEGGTHLFITQDRNPLTYSTFKGTFRRYKEFANLQGFTIHRIRAYSLTEIAKCDPIAAQKVAGHSSLTTTMRYVNYDAAYVRAQYDLADPLGKVLGTKGRKSGKK